MNEREGEPQAADVRSFLPRPGEPVEDYAARLRALHHDLTLVLDAVERGLAAAERAPVREPEPEPVAAFSEPHPEPHRSPPPLGPLAPAARGGARVEVVSGGREQARSGPPVEPTPWGGRPAPVGERAPDGGDPAPERSAREPWVEAPPHPPREGAWTDPDPWEAPAWQQAASWPERRPPAWPPPPAAPRELSFEPPYAMPPPRRMPALSPLLVAATILGWLTVLALILALALD